MHRLTYLQNDEHNIQIFRPGFHILYQKQGLGSRGSHYFKERKNNSVWEASAGLPLTLALSRNQI